MPMSTYKKADRTALSAKNIYDKGNRKLIITYIALVLLLVIAIMSPPSTDYLAAIQEGGKPKGIDNLYDYFIPVLAVIIICYAFFNDYQHNIYKILTFYTHRTFNFLLLRRFFRYIMPLTIGSFLTGIVYFRHISFLDIDSVLLSLRFVPNLLFLSALLLCITVYSKNSFMGLFVTLTYVLIDFLSDSRIFDLLSIGANSNNFFYSFSPEYYYLNRALILFLSILFIFLAGKRAAKL